MQLKSFFPTACATGLLCAGLCVHAQPTVNINGWLDVGVWKKTGGAINLGPVSRSNLAFSGSEDLGSGLSATFRLSTRFELDSGSVEASDAARQFWKDEATVGFRGGFGSVRLGRALTPLWTQSWPYDAWYNFDRIASPHWWQFAPDFLSNPDTREYSRLNNGVFYDSPDLGGFSLHASVGMEKPVGELAHGASVALSYNKNDVSLMFATERNSQKDKVWAVGAAYTMAGLKLMASYSKVELNPAGLIFSSAWTNWAAASVQHTTRSATNLGASYAFGPHTLRAGIGRDVQGATNGFNYIGSSFNTAGTGFSGPATMTSLGYVYALSKRTGIYADLSTTRWTHTDDNGRRSAAGMAMGMTHSF